MKLITPDIVYHNIEPIYTCDLQPKSEDFIRLATGGSDSTVRLWKMNLTYNSHKDFKPVELVANLSRHEKRVNVVRWSPSGNILASGSDDGIIILWSKIDGSPLKSENDDEDNLENWTYKCLRRHFMDIYDLCWSMNENHLISGSIDCCAILWNLKNPNKVIILKDHKQFVQGVAWDPLDNVVITQSADRTMRVYRASTRICIYKVWKSGESKLFQDGSWNFFFRRLAFSPDGKLLITPAGHFEMNPQTDDNSDVYSNRTNETQAAHIFVRHNLSKVAVTIPTGKNPVIGVRFNPVRFGLRNKPSEAVFKLPYRWVFCLQLENGCAIYDTEQCVPLMQISDIHHLSTTDVSWSPDGHCLIITSTDGYCTFLYFDQGELGETYTLVGKSCTQMPLQPIDNIIPLDDNSECQSDEFDLKTPILELDPTEIYHSPSSLANKQEQLQNDDNNKSEPMEPPMDPVSSVVAPHAGEPAPKKRRMTLVPLND